MVVEVCAPGFKKRTTGIVHFKDHGARCRLDYTEHMDQILRSWCGKYPQLSYIDMDRVVLSVAKCRSKSLRGTYASVTSLRFPGGAVNRQCGGRIYRWPKVLKNGHEALYLIKFYLPRFHNLSFEDKVATILHELYHIDPKFNGDFRNFGGRHWAHGSSRASYDAMFAPLTREIVKRHGPMCDLFLNCRFSTLLKRFGDIYGQRYSCIGPYEDKERVLS